MNILVVDDHALVREGIALMLKRMDVNVRVWEIDRGEEAISLLQERPMDIVLLDLDLPGMDGFHVLKRILELAPSTRVAILSALDHPLTAQRCMRAGARGYLKKSMPMDALLQALRAILNDEAPASAGYDANASSRFANAERITQRQQEVLRLLQHGLRNKEIADKLNITEATVKVHIRAICRLFRVNNRHAAIDHARAMGLLQ